MWILFIFIQENENFHNKLASMFNENSYTWLQFTMFKCGGQFLSLILNFEVLSFRRIFILVQCIHIFMYGAFPTRCHQEKLLVLRWLIQQSIRPYDHQLTHSPFYHAEAHIVHVPGVVCYVQSVRPHRVCSHMALIYPNIDC